MNIARINFTARQPIYGQVVAKTDLKSHDHPRDNLQVGALFCFILHDATGNIQITAFQSLAVEYKDLIQLHQHYQISNYYVEEEDSKYVCTQHQYRLKLSEVSTVRIVPADDELFADIKPYNYNPTMLIKDITLDMPYVNVLGICTKVEELGTRFVRCLRDENFRSIWVTDQSNESIRVALWAGDAENFDHENEGKIVYLFAIKPDVFKGERILHSLMSCMIVVDPEEHGIYLDNMPELLKWEKTKSISTGVSTED